MAGTERGGGAQNASGLARTPPWPFQELYQAPEGNTTPVLYQQKFTTKKHTIWLALLCRGEMITF